MKKRKPIKAALLEHILNSSHTMPRASFGHLYVFMVLDLKFIIWDNTGRLIMESLLEKKNY
jgi:hypothetical protein